MSKVQKDCTAQHTSACHPAVKMNQHPEAGSSSLRHRRLWCCRRRTAQLQRRIPPTPTPPLRLPRRQAASEEHRGEGGVRQEVDEAPRRLHFCFISPTSHLRWTRLFQATHSGTRWKGDAAAAVTVETTNIAPSTSPETFAPKYRVGFEAQNVVL